MDEVERVAGERQSKGGEGEEEGGETPLHGEGDLRGVGGVVGGEGKGDDIMLEESSRKVPCLEKTKGTCGMEA